MAAMKVLITGCSSGIGRATAELLGERGYVVFATVRNRERGQDLAEAAREKDCNLSVLPLDVCDDSAVAAAIERVGTVDVLVNNAGFQIYGPMEEMSVSDLVQQFDTNVYGPFRLMKAVLPGMREQRSGVIVNISSYNGRLAYPLNSIYCASNHALEGLSESLRTRWGSSASGST
jgi:NAD(P)-dependent dehydrogenase (short-subunit alcohol dehydrogenase family)